MGGSPGISRWRPFLPQISLNESMQVVSRRALTVAYGEPVHHVMQFDPVDPGFLYLMTSHQVRQAIASQLWCRAFAQADLPLGATSTSAHSCPGLHASRRPCLPNMPSTNAFNLSCPYPHKTVAYWIPSVCRWPV